MCSYSAGSVDAGGRAPKGSLGRRRKRCRGRWRGGDGRVAGEGMDRAVSCCWYASHKIGEIRTNSAMAGMGHCLSSRWDAEGSVVEGLGVPAPSCHNSNQSPEQEG